MVEFDGTKKLADMPLARCPITLVTVSSAELQGLFCCSYESPAEVAISIALKWVYFPEPVPRKEAQCQNPSV